jgi:hypothetical protein
MFPEVVRPEKERKYSETSAGRPKGEGGSDGGEHLIIVKVPEGLRRVGVPFPARPLRERRRRSRSVSWSAKSLPWLRVVESIP